MSFFHFWTELTKKDQYKTSMKMWSEAYKKVICFSRARIGKSRAMML